MNKSFGYCVVEAMEDMIKVAGWVVVATLKVTFWIVGRAVSLARA